MSRNQVSCADTIQKEDRVVKFVALHLRTRLAELC
ncbi:hypothetical protein ES703_03220 [subsurface metagenome]